MIGPLESQHFFAEIRELARDSLERASDPVSCAGLIDEIHRRLETGLLALDRCQVACAAGCGGCCQVNVAVLLPEAIALMEYLQTLSSAQRRELSQGVDRLFARVGGLDEEQRLARGESCAFLSAAGSCLVYPVRPLLCRSITSTDPESCRAALHPSLGQPPPPVLMHLQQKQLCDAAFIALAEAARELGLDDASITLTAAVHHLQHDPGLAAAWLAGGAVPPA